MAYIGIAYSGDDSNLLREAVDFNKEWIDSERRLTFYGNGFLVIYDSITARELVRKIEERISPNLLTVFRMEQIPRSLKEI